MVVLARLNETASRVHSTRREPKKRDDDDDGRPLCPPSPPQPTTNHALPFDTNKHRQRFPRSPAARRPTTASSSLHIFAQQPPGCPACCSRRSPLPPFPSPSTMAPPATYDPGLLEAHIDSLRKGQVLPENVVRSLCEKVRERREGGGEEGRRGGRVKGMCMCALYTCTLGWRWKKREYERESGYQVGGRICGGH